jgi:TolB-like protein
MSFSVTAETVREQLGKILASEAFVRSARMRRFLEFIVEETLAGRETQLGEYGIGTAVFDRGPAFEPALDPIVRNDARRLRMKLLEYYRQEEAAGEVLIEVPKGGYVPVFRSAGSRRAGCAAPRLRRRLAVLPFEVLATRRASAWFGRALCLSLTASLSNLEGVEAVAHSYLREQPVREAAAELQLSHVIHGSVMSSGGRCRVIVNLIRVPDGAQLWARQYECRDGEPDGQSEIARSVVREVKAAFGLGGRQDGPALAA